MPKGGNGGGGPGSGEIKGNKRDNILTGTENADVILGLGGNDELYGLGGDDSLDGGDGDDILSPGAGDDIVEGGAGADTLLLFGVYADYTFELIDATTVRITDTRTGGDGVDLLMNVESFQFADQTLAFADIFRGPDLTASGLALSATTWQAGDTISADWIIANFGDLDAGDSASGIYLSTDPNVTTDDILLVLDPATGLLTPGGSGAEGGAFTVDGALAPGTYYLAAIADTGDAVAEGDETNNTTAPIQITILPPPAPNLTAVGLGLDDIEWLEGDSITATWTIANTGDAAAVGSTSTIYFSTDQILDASDVVLGAVAANSIAADGSLIQNYTFAMPAGLAPGTYYLTVVADDGNAVAESDEGDNIAPFMTITVPDPTIYGTEGADFLTGTLVADVINALGGDDTVIWTSGGDMIDGGEGHDILDFSGRATAVSITASEFDNSPFAYSIAYATTDGDRVVGVEEFIGTAFDDLIDVYGGAADLIVRGGDGADALITGYGADELHGDAGDDILWSGAGDDFLYGGAGNDLIAGDIGDDQVWMGAGADIFIVYRPADGLSGEGVDIIHDFDPTEDTFILEYECLSTAPDLFSMLTDTAEGVRIDYANDSSVLLAGVTMAELNALNLITEEALCAHF